MIHIFAYHAVNELLELLFEHGIVVDFIGDWDDLAVYRYISEELMDEEMDDIRTEGTLYHFDATTPEYDVQFRVEHFVTDVFYQERKYFLSSLEKQPLFDASGRLISMTEFR